MSRLFSNTSRLTPQKSPGQAGFQKLKTKLFAVSCVLTLLTALSVNIPAQAASNSSLAAISSQPILAAGFWDFFGFLGFGVNQNNNGTVKPPIQPKASIDINEESENLDPYSSVSPSGVTAASPCIATGVTLNVPANYPTIQSAINAANANGGDTIQVAAGMYVEQLVISKCVTITGDSRASTIIKSPASLANSNVAGATTAQSIIEVSGNYYVTMSKLTVTGPVNFTSASNGFGIFVLGGSTLNLSDAAVTSIRENPLSGNQRGLAIAAGRTSLNQIGSLILDNVSVTDYQKGGIYVDGQGSTATINRTTVTGAGLTGVTGQNGIQISRGATGTITNSTVSGNAYTNPAAATATGILLFNAGATSISNSTLTGNDAGVYNSVSPLPATLPAFTVSGNTISNTDLTDTYGIILSGSNGSLTNNFLTGTNYSILGYPGDNAVIDVHGNSITGTGNQGIGIYFDDYSGTVAAAQLSANFNRISGNGGGVYNETSSQMNAENNFWGCNTGPNTTGCDTTDGIVDFDPYLMLSHTTSSQASVNAGGNSTITTNLRFNSAGADTFTATNHLPNPIPATASSANSPGGIPVNFTATNGTVNPTVTTLVDGLASTTFTGGTVNGGDQTGTVTAQVDNATNSVNVTVLDSTPPTVVSANVASSTANTVTYTVTFSEAVTGVNTTDFTVTTTGNVAASVASVTGSGTTYTVVVNINSGMGTVQLNVVDNDSIVDTASTPNPLGGAGAGNGNFTGQTFTVDVQMPTVTINQATGQADPTSSSPINFTVVFSEPVTGFDGSDVVFTGSTAGGTLTATVTGSGTTYNVAVSGMTTSGTVVASIPANAAFDSANNGNAASMSTDNSVTYLKGIVTNITRGTTFTTIQAANDDAQTQNGDTIRASAGVYLERVNVTKSLTIQGAQYGNDARTGRTNVNAESTVGISTGAFNVQSAVTVTIDGFRLTGANAVGDTPAIYLGGSPGSLIVNDIIEGNSRGAYFTAQNSTFRHNRLNNTGDGFFGGVDNTTVEENLFTGGHPDGAVNTTVSSGDSTVDNYKLINNVSQGSGNFGVIFATVGSQISGNTIANTTGSALFVGGGNSNLNVQNNTFTGTQRQAINVNDAGFGYGNNSNINFIGNNVTRSITDNDDGFSTVDYRGVAGSNQIFGNTITLAQAGGTTTNPTGYGVRVRGSGSGNFEITGNVFNGGGIVSNTTTPATSGVVLSSNQAAANPATNGGQLPTSSVFNINCNSFSGLQNGIIAYNFVANTTGGLPTGIVVKANGDNFLGNSLFGINNSGTSATIDATNSYWNSPSGPSGAGPGSGDAVSANVTYNPFLTSPSMCAPVNNVPAAQTINQDTTLTFSGANQISVTDLDAGNTPVTVMLSVTNGTLTLSQTTGLTVTGNGTGNVTFSGTLAAVNAALNGLTFTPNAGFVGTSTLTITSSSMGSPGVGGGTQTDTDTVTINVLDAVAPTVTINQGNNQADPTSTSPITFDVVFSETVTGFDASDVVVTGSAFGTGVTPTVTVTGSGANYTVTVSGMTQSGTVRASIPAGAAMDAQGNLSTASTSTDNTVFFNFVAVNPTTVIQPVNPVNIMAQQFAFLNEGATGSGAFVTGPATPPGGIGSAQLTIDGTGRENLVTARYGGTRLADISALRYSAYTNRTDGLTITLQFDVDYDLSDANNAFQNRLVYEPAAQAIPVAQNTWQTFDTLAGKFYSSNAGNAGGQAGCTQATPCTKAQLLALFPNVGIRGGANAAVQGGLYLRAGGPFAGGAVLNADNLVVGVNGNTTTFDFEPTPPTLSINNVSVMEGNSGTTAANFTITQSAVSALPTTVTVNTADGSATVADNDYQPIVNGTATIPTGQTSTTVTVLVNGDTNPESDETFTINLSNAVNAVINQGQGIGTITNDDITVTINQAVGQVDPTSTSPINFTVVFNEPVADFATGDVTVTGSAFGMGSTPTATVTGSGTTYNVAVSGMTQSGTVMASIGAGVAHDADGNPNTASTSTDNTVFFNFVAVNPTTVIQPVNPVNIMAQQFAFLNEGATGSGAFVTGPATPPGGIGSAQLTIDGTGRENLVTARYGGTRLADISALRYSAYTNRNDNLTITLQFDVDYDLTDANYAYQNRLVYEPAAQGITVAPNTWQDFDTLAGRFYSSNPNNAGGQAGCTQATPCTKAQLLALFPNVGIFGGANAPFQGGLYLRAGGPFAGGAVLNADNLVVGVNGNTTTFDFEPSPPTLSIGNATVTEGNSGTTAATFTITQSVASQLPTTVTINTADGSATVADNDYQPIVGGTATIAAGQTSTTVTVNVVGDTKVEGNETFRVNLSNALNAAIADPQGLGTINNDDVTVSFSSPTYSIGEAGGTATITVTRNGVTPNPVTVDYATSNGSATGGAACTTGVDFINTSGTLTFAGNATTQTFTVTICDDNISEPPPAGETVNLTLSNPTGGATLGLAAAVLTIIDNDGGGLVTISGNIQMNNAPAANTNLQGVTVTLSGSSSGTTTTDQNGNYSFTGLTAGGSYKVTPSGLGKIYDPIYRNYASLNVNITNANFIAYNSINDVPRKVRFGQTTVSPGNQVTVPVLLDALGNENGVSFSFTYDTTKLSNPVVTLGTDDQGATLIVNNGTPGTVGVTLVEPSGQTFGAAGTKQIVNVQFNTAANTSANTALTFTNSPTTRSVNDVNANPLQAQFINGTVVFAQGLEADVDPRPSGDGDVDLGDFNQVGQFAAGLATPGFATTNEFQRADCEPTASKGDGDVDLGDFIQAGRYAATLDPTQPVGGPAYPTAMTLANLKPIFETGKSSAVPRIVSAANVNGSAGNNVTVAIQIDAESNDKGTSFTLDYDATKLSNPQVSLGSGGSGGFLIPNTNNSGKVIVQLAYITGGFQAGVSQIILIQFTVANNAAAGVTPLTFNDTPVQRQVRDTNNIQVAATFNDGSVNILGATASSVSVGGKVQNTKGRGVANAQIIMTNNRGDVRVTRSNPYGFFAFTEVPAGETYTFNIRSKQYTFAPQSVNVLQNLDSLVFTADK